ncbi:hypothetical protein KIS4809_5739 [Bacillus sp. ZZV12-4809]|nr:hypothetical protein KIS4809_5739 [Bacillus sp. ZZV12-4809]
MVSNNVYENSQKNKEWVMQLCIYLKSGSMMTTAYLME